MIKEKAMKLVAALRSGVYQQTKDYLHRADGTMCCLGVACAISKKPIKRDLTLNYYGEKTDHYAYDGAVGFCLSRS